MSPGQDQFEDHDRFKQLCALSVAGNLKAGEPAELKAHLEVCEQCRTLHGEYLLVARDGMPMLAVRFDHPQEVRGWDNSNVKSKIFERLAEKAKQATVPIAPRVIPLLEGQPRRKVMLPAALTLGIAACLVLAVGFGAYRAGRSKVVTVKQVDTAAEARLLKLANEKQAADDLLSADELKLRKLEGDFAARQGELEKLKAQLKTNEEQRNEIASGKDASDAKLQSVSQERDTLNAKLADAQQAYQSIQAELRNIKADRDQATMRSASYQKQVEDLVAENRDQQRQLGTRDQYLSEDRDIREIMGARQLYIADVFDVSSDSRTRKPYGRVFYTKRKSLIFYAFDLDRQPHVTEASTFQVWGKNESAQDRPVNLGVLYVDNEANRRWALRCDDPQQLAEIDAVFVTVEPNAHGNRPTGKPFLYASLRKEANHP
jgi:hypothetical protein